MKNTLPAKLVALAENCPEPLYVVGGAVRDHLAGLSSAKRDLDICAPLSANFFSFVAEKCGMTLSAVYRNTGTVKLKDPDGNEYEYTSFRSDKYVRGSHVPVRVFFTKDINLDARRRDFTANAVYYDIVADKFVDPLNGIADIKAKRLETVDRAEKVFGEDGLRLMRLARLAGQLGFTPSKACLEGARVNAALIKDISPERVWTELNAILRADRKYGNKRGHYVALKILEQTGVLEQLIPELTAGKGLEQRSDFHKYDVLEHSLRTVLYAKPKVRLAALLHDVGKPFCAKRDGNVYEHPSEGAWISEEILRRFKAPKQIASRVRKLVFLHMYDFDGVTRPGKLRRFFVQHAELIEELLLLKQADYSGCKDDTSLCPTARKWLAEIAKIREEKAPITLKQLAVSGKDVAAVEGVEPRYISLVLNELLLHAALLPNDNTKEHLLRLVPSCLKAVHEQIELKKSKRAKKAEQTEKKS